MSVNLASLPSRIAAELNEGWRVAYVTLHNDAESMSAELHHPDGRMLRMAGFVDASGRGKGHLTVEPRYSARVAAHLPGTARVGRVHRRITARPRYIAEDIRTNLLYDRPGSYTDTHRVAQKAADAAAKAQRNGERVQQEDPKAALAQIATVFGLPEPANIDWFLEGHTDSRSGVLAVSARTLGATFDRRSQSRVPVTSLTILMAPEHQTRILAAIKAALCPVGPTS